MTSQDSTLPTVDYLGHPCAIAKALKNFEDSVSRAREMAAREPRELDRQIGKGLNRVYERLEHVCHCLSVIYASLPSDDDADGARAIATMAEEYAVETANELFDLAGQSLVALERVSPQGKAQ